MFDLFTLGVIKIATDDVMNIIFYVIGGLGIFLYGLNLMGESLKAVAGNKLKVLIEKSTNTPLKGILVGLVVTVLIQSSSGTTALSVGLVRAGLMTLPQAVGVIMGANIGTTVTSFLIGLKIKAYALPIVFIGASMIFFFNKKKINKLGGVFLGFGLLFFGLDLMGSALKPLTQTDQFASLMVALSGNRFYGVLVGTGLTAFVQSSSASIGVLQELYTSGEVPLEAAIPILFGSNIGTTITAVFAAIGGSIAARRTAAAHVIFNVLGVVVFLILLDPYVDFAYYVQDTFFGGEPDNLTIAFAHFGFNIVTTFVMFFFVGQLVELVKRIIPSKDEVNFELTADSLDDKLITESPVFALESVKQVIVNMGKFVDKMLNQTYSYFQKQDDKLFESTYSIEQIIDTFDRKTHDYLVKLSSEDMDFETSELHAKYVDTIRDFERIGDHCQNLLDFFESRYEDKSVMHDDESKEISKIFDILVLMIKNAVDAFENSDKVLAAEIQGEEDLVDQLVRKYRKRHVKRLQSENRKDDLIYVDILSNLERIGDHCDNIALHIIQDSYFVEEDED